MIWWYAFGYFAAYVPYSALTKALADGLVPGMTGGIAGFELLPSTAMASLVGMFAFVSAMGWWKFAGRRKFLGVEFPCPTKWTLLSGFCTAAIIPTTTLAYTFTGVSIVFMMLLMRGGVLVIAPIVDIFSKRKVRWTSWVALALALSALFVGFSGKSFEMTLVAILTVAIYLAAYFVRLRFMTRLAKSNDPDAKKRYFVEEQMVATPVLVLMLLLTGGMGTSAVAASTWSGFTGFFSQPSLIVLIAISIGLFSQGTGIFGGLVLLDKRENTFCVPVNRASSVLAGLAATLALWFFADKKFPSNPELLGALIIIGAIAVLSAPSLMENRRAPAIRNEKRPLPDRLAIIAD
ncbi:MAG TPA: hypothetical protein DCS07_09855 [Bdellovibrionales bacterium]|nr:MAG: hypothetical protein A2Z97_00410 [Bdellovibrionales bacterium GWB1_52_6]OFZ03232.1 MAG: hypothetical protein A2X97_09900 [Bdellovibrionales bacterium GWA1_52_35]OFZ38246.1 MAG: hypothetical protein A2070_05055 [Bdellovibrionales bacterium GWC1_52_8]HAR42916.1 hypothetical protein [Bdellovibrionales bacterium]HCM40587.1 hypothetical protein [Bdellovibrionales bacterium]